MIVFYANICFFFVLIMFLLLIVRILNESGKKVNFTFYFKRLQKIRIIVMQIFYFVRR